MNSGSQLQQDAMRTITAVTQPGEKPSRLMVAIMAWQWQLADKQK